MKPVTTATDPRDLSWVDRILGEGSGEQIAKTLKPVPATTSLESAWIKRMATLRAKRGQLDRSRS